MRHDFLIDPIEAAIDAHSYAVYDALWRYGGLTPARALDAIDEARRVIVGHVEAEEWRRHKLATADTTRRIREGLRHG